MNKKSLLLIVIYFAFISLGLPDSLLGSGWPVMSLDLGVPTHYGGYLSMIIAAGTVISSLFSGQLIQRFGVSQLTILSVFLTAGSLLGYSFSNNYLFLCLLSIPLGLGAGSVDSALNHYVSIHYEAKHMNWLHAFWGVGASIGPMIMAFYLAHGSLWQSGYRAVGIIQLGMVMLLIAAASLWVTTKDQNDDQNETNQGIKKNSIFSIPGLPSTLIVFFCYGTIEATFGLWGASYLVYTKQFSADHAARYIGLYYVGITIGRFFSGVLTSWFTNKQLVYLGLMIIAVGLFGLFQNNQSLLLVSFLMIGLGCAPIFPSLLHDTPVNFGQKNAQSIMGIQMASSYIGITFMPMLFGLLADQLGFMALAYFLTVILITMLLFFYLMRKQFSSKDLAK